MKNKYLKISLIVASVLFFTNGAIAAMLQKPIQATAGVVPPNVMFTLDDSGSMGFECIPDALCIGSKYVGTMPDPSGWSNTWKNGVATYDKVTTTTTGGGCKTYQGSGKKKTCIEYYPVVTTTDVVEDIFNRQMRSAASNPLYYNPEVRYLPWLKVDGTRYPEYPGTAARYFPETSNSTYVQNLAVDTAINTAWCTTDSSCKTESQTVYLAQYFNMTANASSSNVSSYTQVKIQSGSTYPKSVARADCVAMSGVCTYDEELQNFSNWFSYHRSRIRVGIAGTAEAFYSVPGNYRVGYGRINKSSSTDIDGISLSTVEKGVRPFVNTTAGNKGAFYTWLFQQSPRSGGTPLRYAMNNVGRYYSYVSNKGPWGEEPGVNNTADQLSCRRSFHMLMTDGMWNGSAASTLEATVNVDNLAGTKINSPNNSLSYTYLPTKPYKDGASNTLADVAMYYWNRDLNEGLANGVSPSSGNPAFWQHMVNYTISFGALGVLNPATDLPGLVSGTKSWPTPGADKAENIDDLWHAAVNSRGRYLKASNTTEYSNALKDIIDDIASINGSEAGVAVSAKTLSTTSTTRKYEAEFSSARWSGDVKAINLTSTGLDDGDPVWVAVGNFPAYASRNILTYNKDASGTKGIPLTWANLSSTMKSTVLDGASLNGTDLINYLRGDRTNEVGTYRYRASVLGDIVNSTPILIKDRTNGQYGFLPKTSAFSAAQSSYRRFLVAKAQRNAQLFVGANDGMLHAFSDIDGTETFAFMPDSVLGKVKRLSALDYEHEYFVDGPLAEADVYDASASKWRNLVLGGTGAGAKSLFAINVPVVNYPSTATTVPAALSVAESAPGVSDILWSISNADTANPKNFSELGYVLQAPEYGVMRDGTWVVIAGNGYDSTSKKAQLFIINALTGDVIKRLDTGIGSSNTPNGLGGARVVRNINQQIVAVYAGDLLGNLWKFDFSSEKPSDWAVAFGGNPLYTTAAVEPITAAPTYILHPGGGVMVLFGTGKLYEAGDEGVTAQRALYGIWDRVALGALSTSATDRITEQQTIVPQALSATASSGTEGTFYNLTVTPVDFEVKPDTETRPAYMTKRGWRLPLTIGAGQRLIDNPEIAGSLALVQTVTPASTQAACTASSLIRYGFLLDPFMKAIEKATFDTNNDNTFTSDDVLTASAVFLVGSGPATMLREFGKDKFRLTQARTGLLQNPMARSSITGTKRYWRQINPR